MLTNNNPMQRQSPDMYECNSLWLRRRADHDRFRIFELRSTQPKTDTPIIGEPHLIKADRARTFALHITLQLLAGEMSEQSPGTEVVVNRLAEVLFIQAIRAHITSGAELQTWMAPLNC